MSDAAAESTPQPPREPAQSRSEAAQPPREPAQSRSEPAQPRSEPDALLSRLRAIEDQPLESRAAAFTQLHDELQHRLEGVDSAASR